VVVDGQLCEEALTRPPGEVIAPSYRASRVRS
jgi:hypothetical protein